MARERSEQLEEQVRDQLRQVHAGAYGGLVLAKEDLISSKGFKGSWAARKRVRHAERALITVERTLRAEGMQVFMPELLVGPIDELFPERPAHGTCGTDSLPEQALPSQEPIPSEPQLDGPLVQQSASGE